MASERGALRRLEELAQRKGLRVESAMHESAFPHLVCTVLQLVAGDAIAAAVSCLHRPGDERATDCAARLILEGLGVPGGK